MLRKSCGHNTGRTCSGDRESTACFLTTAHREDDRLGRYLEVAVLLIHGIDRLLGSDLHNEGVKKDLYGRIFLSGFRIT